MASMELIMEKIRSKASQYKSFAECAKALRMSQLEKRFPMDVADRNQLQKCLDTLQQSMKVNTLQGIVERLESISRQLSLKLMAGQTGLELFISSDMFYLEVSLEPSGNVKDVKVHHEGKSEQQSCDELVKSLSNGDFDDFTTQLQGLISIYQLNAEKKVKCKAFSALCALESDLDALWSLHSHIKDPQTLLNKSPVGVLEKRKGGHPMKLTYFVSPYEVLESKKDLSLELIHKNKMGFNVTICLEGSAAHTLQTAQLVSISKTSGKSIPAFSPMTPANSTTLPAYFVLKLNKPLPICVELVNRINTITELECCDTSNAHPLFSLVTQHISNGKMDSALNKGLFVNLPDQVHCYFMTECKGLDGVIVSSIPFTHPSQVSQILALLRQQAFFNALITSAVRPRSKQELENMIMLEISALSCQHISVSFEHPMQESMSTLEIDLTDISAVRTELYASCLDTNSKTTTEQSSKILQRCLSIPVTMRYLIKNLQNQQIDMSSSLINNGGFSSAPNGGLGGSNDHSPIDTSKIKQEPGISNGVNGRSQGTLGSQFDDFSSFSSSVLDSNIQKASSILNIVPESQKKIRKHEKHRKNVKQRAVDDCEILLESSSNDSITLTTPMEVDVDPDILQHDKEDIMNAVDLDDVEEMLKATVAPTRSDLKIKRPKEVKKSPSHTSLLADRADGKALVPPSVTITPITSNVTNFSSVLERRPGIEIIPLSSTTTSNLSSSITITPISSSSGDKDERKTFKNRTLEEKMREKKRKRRREDEVGSKMGPPEKVPAKSDPLSKPVSVSIKPATDSPPNIRPNSPSVRKFTTSPTQMRDKSSSGSSIHPSPKHPPAYGSSPKHSPKHGTSSPKQPSSGSGKPSMSALKSASSSPNSSKNPSEGKIKTSSSGSSSATGGSANKEQRDKDSSRKSSGSSSNSSSGNTGSPKTKSSNFKLKEADFLSNEISITNASGSSTPPNSGVAGNLKNLGNPLQRNRKGSLSAIIDKLKSEQEVIDTVNPMNTKRDVSNNGGSSKEIKLSAGASASVVSKMSIDGKTAIVQKIPDGVKNPAEYMVKPSSDGMKITINKTRSKDMSKIKSGSSSGSGSPKTHTGLKPGVISGPASKKPVTSKTSSLTGLSSKISTSSSSKSSSSSSSLKSSSSVTKSLSSKNTGSPKTTGSGPTDLSRKESIGKSRPPKVPSDKSVFKDGVRRSSPAPSKEEEHERALRVLKIESGIIPSTAKPFDKYQIPKLSARNNNNNSSSNNNNNNNNHNLNSSNSSSGSSSSSNSSNSSSSSSSIGGGGSSGGGGGGGSSNTGGGGSGSGSSSSSGTSSNSNTSNINTNVNININTGGGSTSGSSSNSNVSSGGGGGGGSSGSTSAISSSGSNVSNTSSASSSISKSSHVVEEDNGSIVSKNSNSNSDNTLSTDSAADCSNINNPNSNMETEAVISISGDSSEISASVPGSTLNSASINSSNNSGNNSSSSSGGGSNVSCNVNSSSSSSASASSSNINSSNSSGASNNTTASTATTITTTTTTTAAATATPTTNSNIENDNDGNYINNNNNIKVSNEKIIEKPEVKTVDSASSKSSLAANLKYQTSKHDSDRMAKVPSLNVPGLSLPLTRPNVSPKLPMMSPNLPTTSRSSITSKLENSDDSVSGETLSDKNELDPKVCTVDVAGVKFPASSTVKPEDLKKSTDITKHLIPAPPQSTNILLDFSSNSNLSIKMGGTGEKTDKTLLGTTTSCFSKPNSPAVFAKSPVQSPIMNVIPSHSPQSITDDDLMDEALLLRK